MVNYYCLCRATGPAPSRRARSADTAGRAPNGGGRSRRIAALDRAVMWGVISAQELYSLDRVSVAVPEEPFVTMVPRWIKDLSISACHYFTRGKKKKKNNKPKTSFQGQKRSREPILSLPSAEIMKRMKIKAIQQVVSGMSHTASL